jgi:GTP pyrophosphokinase
VRARLARLTAAKATGIPPVLEPLTRIVRASHPKADVRPLVRAYEVAEQCHEGQRRRSGDPYITHPLAVTTILAELGMDTTTLVAALLHDTVEDTRYTLDDVRKEFGVDVGHLVDGVTKLDKVQFGDAAEAETIRKMVVAMARDPRVLVIKLADRLHNMRTLRWLQQEKQERIARQTLEIFAPLAHRLGMNTLKWELEDLAFATLYPKRYDEIVRLVAERAPSRDTQLAQVVERISTELKAAKIRATVTGPPEALLLDLPEDDRARSRLHRHLRPGGHPGPGRRRAGLLRRARHRARLVVAGARAASRTSSRCRSSTCTSRCTPR